MATQPNDLPATKDAATIYTTDAHSSSGPTETPEPRHYPEPTEETKQGASFVTIFLIISAVVVLALILWRVAVMMSVI